MAKTSLKILLIASISSFVLFFNSDNSKSCSFNFSADDYYSVFNPKLIDQPSLIPFFLSDLLFFPEEDSLLYNDKLQNLLDWKKYFDDKPEIADIEKLIYPTDKNDLLEILNYLKKKDYSLLKEKYQTNSFVGYLKKTRNIDAAEYLVYAKMCEPHVAEYNYWHPPIKDSLAMHELIEEGINRYKNISDKFLKARYAFQFIRLAHYSGNYNKAVGLYDNFVSGLDVEGIINYWALSLKAGALKHLNKEVESNYLYSIVYDKCDTRKYVAAKDFKARSDSSFSSSLALCKNNSEKAAFWMLAAFRNNDFQFKAMQQIYLLEPKSPYLELLLSREVNKVERELFPNTYAYNVSSRNFLSENNWLKSDYYKNLLSLVRDYARSNNTLHPYLWNLAAGYLLTLSGDMPNATGYYANANSFWPKDDKKGLAKLKLFREMNAALIFHELDVGAEKRILSHLGWLYEQSHLSSEKYKYVGEFYVPGRNDELSAFLYVRSKLAQVYASDGNFLKMHLCLGDSKFGYDLTADPKNQPINDLIAFFEKPKKTEFEEFLKKIYRYNKTTLLEIKGTTLLSQHKFKEAIIAFNDAGSSWKLRADPFVHRIKDCLSCDAREKNKTNYTKLTFSQRMLELDSLAKSDKENAFKYYFLMANGFYNITFYGNCWDATSYYRNYDYDQMYDETKDWEFYDCSTAQEYYKKAMGLTTDWEFAAMCVFMMSKCEQNDFYNNLYQMHFKKDGDYLKKKLEYRNNFRLLQDNYNDTEFYKDALKECKYFNIFLNGNIEN